MYKVSIVIPIYNREDYLYECLDSVVNQTMFEEIEVLLINDGSTDNSEEICLEYVKKHPNIKYFYQENQGVSAARNHGMDKAGGEYIYFMDSDDSINDIFIESAYKNAKENDSDIVFVGLTPSYLKINQMVCCNGWQLLIKTSYLKSINVKFSTSLKTAEDVLFTCVILSKTERITVEWKSKYYYRRNTPNSLVKNEQSWAFYVQIKQALLNEFKSNYSENCNENQYILKTIALDLFYTTFYRFSILQKIKILSLINDFIIQVHADLIKFNPFEYHWRFVLLYSLFNIIYAPAFMIGKFRQYTQNIYNGIRH